MPYLDSPATLAAGQSVPRSLTTHTERSGGRVVSDAERSEARGADRPNYSTGADIQGPEQRRTVTTGLAPAVGLSRRRSVYLRAGWFNRRLKTHADAR
jgi:hypothetical protein